MTFDESIPVPAYCRYRNTTTCTKVVVEVRWATRKHRDGGEGRTTYFWGLCVHHAVVSTPGLGSWTIEQVVAINARAAARAEAEALFSVNKQD